MRYHSCDSYLPDYLIRGTLEFGINFLTFQAVEGDTLEALAGCLRQPWEREGDEEQEEFTASAVSLSADLLSSIGHRSLPEEPSELSAATERRDRALSRMLSNSVAEAEAEIQESPADDSARESSQQVSRGKRKRKGASSAGSRPVKTKKGTPKTPETVGSDEGESGSAAFKQTNEQTN